MNKCSEISNDMVVYFWDALKEEQVINLRKTSKYFKSLYSFNPADVQKYRGLHIQQTTNFFFPFNNNAVLSKNKISYVGNYSLTRAELISSFISHLNENYHYALDINLINRNRLEIDDIPNKHINILYKAISYDENLKKLSNSFLTLDIKPDWHNGLSFRFFESLYLKNKIITNNIDVKNYDFYHPDNIFITDYFNIKGLDEFLNKPYLEIDEHLIYGLEDWDFWISLLKRGEATYKLNYLGFYYRIKKTSMLKDLQNERLILMQNLIFKKHIDFFLKEKGTYHENLKKIENLKKESTKLRGLYKNLLFRILIKLKLLN